jgi:hypothetical protein
MCTSIIEAACIVVLHISQCAFIVERPEGYHWHHPYHLYNPSPILHLYHCGIPHWYQHSCVHWHVHMSITMRIRKSRNRVRLAPLKQGRQAKADGIFSICKSNLSRSFIIGSIWQFVPNPTMMPEYCTELYLRTVVLNPVPSHLNESYTNSYHGTRF